MVKLKVQPAAQRNNRSELYKSE